MAFRNLDEVRRANKAQGLHFFDDLTIQFFNSRIESYLVDGHYFVTSERYDDTTPRLYTLRYAHESGVIETVGEFQQYESVESALEGVGGHK